MDAYNGRMRYAGPLLRWGLFLAFLVALGAGVFLQVRHRPRCVIRQELEIMQLSADGKQLLAGSDVKSNPRAAPSDKATIAVWDLAQGRQERVLLEQTGWDFLALSPDGRLLAAPPGDGTVRLIDWRRGEHRILRVNLPANEPQLAFSPKGRWVYRRLPPHAIIDVAAGKLALSREQGDIIGFDAAEECAWFREDRRISIWSLRTGERQAELARDDSFNPVPWDETEHRPLFGVEHYEEQVGAGAPQAKFRYAWWDLETRQKRVSPPLPTEPGRVRILAANADYCVVENFEERAKVRLDVLELATGRIAIASRLTHSGEAIFSPDGTYLCVRDAMTSALTMFELPSGRTLWHKAGVGYAAFAGATGVVRASGDMEGGFQGLDVRTGALVWAAPAHGLFMDFMTSTADGLHVVALYQQQNQPRFWDPWLEWLWPEAFEGPRFHTLVFEASTGRELLRLRNHVAEGYVLSEDASTLVTQNSGPDRQAPTIRVWDVHPRRAWMWAIGSAVATGVGLLALRRGWRSWRARNPASRAA
jgi:WD40 repeat protein